MNRKANWNRNAQFVVVLLCALALKLFYSTANANELRWILAPTTALVELLSGTRFEFESYAGYINSDRSFVIAAACAGVNFLITAFLMLSLRMLWLDRSQDRSQMHSDNLERRDNLERSKNLAWGFIPIVLLLSFVATIMTNTIRISIALWFRQTRFEMSWLSSEQLHRLEGILVYFGMLLLLFVVSERLNAKSVWRNSDRSLLRKALFPLLLYYLTALGIPLANSAYHGRFGAGDFWEHSVFVILTPLLLMLLILTLAGIRRYAVFTSSGEPPTGRWFGIPKSVKRTI